MTNSPRVSGSNRLPILFYIFHEHFSRLESGDVVLGDDDCSILGNVAGCFFRTFLDDEATEAAKIYIVAMSERVFDHVHEVLDSDEHIGLFKTVRLAISLTMSALVIVVRNFLIIG